MFLIENLLGRRVRTLLTILGVAIGIATFVSLGAIAQGFKSQLNQFFSVGSAHLVVTQRGASDPMFSYLSVSLLEELGKVEGVTEAHPFLLALRQIPSQPLFFFYGVTPKSPFLEQLSMVEGRAPATVEPKPSGERGSEEAEVSLGEAAARYLGLSCGSVLDLGEKSYRVVGIYRTSIGIVESGGVLEFSEAQRLAGLEGKMSCGLLTLDDVDGVALQEIETRIESSFPGLSAAIPEGLSRSFQQFDLVDELVGALSILAVLVGGIAVMNTMLMSVFERTREIGILQAVGWGKTRIFGGLLVESLILCGVAGPVGVALGIGVVELVGAVGNLTWIDGSYSLNLLTRAFGVAGGMALLGSLYPALRALRITPVEALRHE